MRFKVLHGTVMIKWGEGSKKSLFVSNSSSCRLSANHCWWFDSPFFSWCSTFELNVHLLFKQLLSSMVPMWLLAAWTPPFSPWAMADDGLTNGTQKSLKNTLLSPPLYWYHHPWPRYLSPFRSFHSQEARSNLSGFWTFEVQVLISCTINRIHLSVAPVDHHVLGWVQLWCRYQERDQHAQGNQKLSVTRGADRQRIVLEIKKRSVPKRKARTKLVQNAGRAKDGMWNDEWLLRWGVGWRKKDGHFPWSTRFTRIWTFHFVFVVDPNLEWYLIRNTNDSSWVCPLSDKFRRSELLDDGCPFDDRR